MDPQFGVFVFPLLVLFTSISSTDALNNARGIQPTRGWVTNPAFRCDIKQELIEDQVQVLGSTSLGAVYNTVLLDCGWQGTERGPEQQFQMVHFC